MFCDNVLENADVLEEFCSAPGRITFSAHVYTQLNQGSGFCENEMYTFTLIRQVTGHLCT